MECEMCGSNTTTRNYLVEGNTLKLGQCCAKYGEALDAPAKAGSKAAMQQGLERRAQRGQTRDIYAEEKWDLVADFGARIKQAVARKKMSYENLGTKVHARVPQLHKIERNELRPSDQLAKALEKELGITLLEKMDASAPVVQGANKAASAGMTLGDILKDALKK